MKWSDLDMESKARFISDAVKSGITNRNNIIAVFEEQDENNEFAKGGKVKHANEGFIPTSDDELYKWLRNEEGFLTTPTDIGDNRFTVGSGLTNPSDIATARKAGKWTEAMNRKAVFREINSRRTRLSKDIPNWDILPDSAKYALISYDYNYPLSAKKSPKLYAALKAKNWQEAAKQMDATSSNPKFKKGLLDRRLREQTLFMSGFKNPTVVNNPLPKPTTLVKGNPELPILPLNGITERIVNSQVPQVAQKIITPKVNNQVAKAVAVKQRRNNFESMQNMLNLLSNPLGVITNNLNLNPLSGLATYNDANKQAYLQSTEGLIPFLLRNQ